MNRTRYEMSSENLREVVVDLKGVEVTYHSKPSLQFKGGVRVKPAEYLTVLKDLDLVIREGEFVTIVGPSGCGKSTLFRLILGSQFPTAGQVLVAGEEVKHVTPNTGIVYQRYSLFAHLTVLNNIALGPLLIQTGPFESIVRSLLPRYRRVLNEARKEGAKLLESVGLTVEDGNKFPHELSGGMQQRVAIAQALIMKPKVLLMDEPFGALDHSTREDMQLFILEQAQKHKLTVIFVTHDLDEAVFLGTRVIGLSQYWTADQGEDQIGARIVTDRDITAGLGISYPRPTSVVDSPAFRQIRRKVHEDVLNPEHRQRIADFDHDHADSTAL